jgi:hypothetical protein
MTGVKTAISNLSIFLLDWLAVKRTRAERGVLHRGWKARSDRF